MSTQPPAYANDDDYVSNQHAWGLFKSVTRQCLCVSCPNCGLFYRLKDAHEYPGGEVALRRDIGHSCNHKYRLREVDVADLEQERA